MIRGQCVCACQIQAFLEMISARWLCLLILKRYYTRLITSAIALEPDFICVKRSEGKSMYVQRTGSKLHVQFKHLSPRPISNIKLKMPCRKKNAHAFVGFDKQTYIPHRINSCSSSTFKCKNINVKHNHCTTPSCEIISLFYRQGKYKQVSGRAHI